MNSHSFSPVEPRTAHRLDGPQLVKTVPSAPMVVASPGKPASGPQPKWVETESQLGTHGQEGAPARTVDELYAEAARLVSEPVPPGWMNGGKPVAAPLSVTVLTLVVLAPPMK